MFVTLNERDIHWKVCDTGVESVYENYLNLISLAFDSSEQQYDHNIKTLVSTKWRS